MNDRDTTIEKNIVTRTVDTLLAAGYQLNVDNGGDVPELPAATTDRAAILAVMMQTDSEHLLTLSPVGKRAWVHFVYGNDSGIDVITDYLTSLDDVLAPVLAYVETLEA